jgi:hypothetical protein
VSVPASRLEVMATATAARVSVPTNKTTYR